jgi:CDP-glucose 4,6-dehydratase
MHYLITGHTGFKGSWLALILNLQGHDVSGISLEPAEKSLYNQAHLHTVFENDLRIDIRNRAEIKPAIEKINPEVIIHLAAQPLVRESFNIPLETFDVNVLGTLNILEATRELSNLKAVLVITTDKVYKNHNHLRGYIESDEIGGDDPYSASKAAADIATQSWVKSFATVPVAIARAGNVIGGGDWAQDRIIPDLVNAYSNSRLPLLRNPNAVRPWQHVLDCLNGYLALVKKQISEGFAGEWNFGPNLHEKNTVGELANLFATAWGVAGDAWYLDLEPQLHEPATLLLDSGKSHHQLGWKNNLDFKTGVIWTAEWYKSFDKVSPRDLCESQIKKFVGL